MTRNNASNVHFAFGPVMKKKSFPRINASDEFLACHEKHAFPRNNATNLHLFWHVMRKPALHVIMHQI